MIHHLPRPHLLLRPGLVLRRRCPGSGRSAACRRVLRLCDGRRTVREIAREAQLPPALSWLILWLALHFQALEVAGRPAPLHSEQEFLRQLQGLLTCALGPAGDCLLERARLMLRPGLPKRPRERPLEVQDALHLLIAVELVASDWERQQIVDFLDALRERVPAITAPGSRP